MTGARIPLDFLACAFPLLRVVRHHKLPPFGFPLLKPFNYLTFALVEFGGALAR